MMDYVPIINMLLKLNIRGYVCGGSARDLYRKIDPYTHDIAVNATIADLRKILNTRIDSVNEYTTCVRIEYNKKTYHLYPLKKIELVNTYYNYSFTDSLQEDSEHRDFTINALYFDPLNNKWHDFHNGRKDIDNKIIRFVGDGEQRILESKIRILRAATLPAILGNDWTVEDSTKESIKANKLRLISVIQKQIYPEMIKLFKRAEKPSIAFKLLNDFSVLFDFFPELANCIGIEQTNKSKDLDLFEHTMLTLDSISKTHPKSIILRSAALLHDIGKPYTQVTTNTGLHFYNHEHVGGYLSEKILLNWGYPEGLIKKIKSLIVHHLFDANPHRSTASIKKLIQKVGGSQIHDLLDLRRADRLGTGRSDISMDKIDLLQEKINEILLDINPENFKLAISARQLLSEEAISNNKIKETTKELVEYTKTRIGLKELRNTEEDIKKEINKILQIDCPLSKIHLFKTLRKVSEETADILPDGRLSCGMFCNFLCNNTILKK